MTDFLKAVAEVTDRQQNQLVFQQMLERQMKEAGEFARMIFEKQTCGPVTIKSF